ncbi:Endonuclease/exonuclease/phosphatase [Dichomitus squalens]|nr:Endonuclease/exonuclease/phosphatase [Dichomitus squalens]
MPPRDLGEGLSPPTEFGEDCPDDPRGREAAREPAQDTEGPGLSTAEDSDGGLPRAGGPSHERSETGTEIPPIRTKKTAIRIASLNMDGFGSLTPDALDNKWGKIYSLMKLNRIGVLLLQETHLTTDRVNSLHKRFSSRIRIYFSSHPDSPTRKDGVAIVVNRSLVSTADADAVEIHPGRAIQLTFKCLGDVPTTVLNIYAPASDGIQARSAFFREVADEYARSPRLQKPQLMAGDFNNIEDAIDRLPMSDPPDNSVLALDELKATHPDRRAYTFHRQTRNRASLSRLDRIYWDIQQPTLKTDHTLVSVRLTSENAPKVGMGRPVFPLRLLPGLKAMKQLDNLESGSPRLITDNPQLIMASLKKEWLRLGREREKQIIPSIMSEIQNLEKAAASLSQKMHIPEDVRAGKVAACMAQAEHLKIKMVRQNQERARATHRMQGERPTKYWSKLHKKQEPRELVQAYEIEGQRSPSGEQCYQKDSQQMAEMAREYHDNIQQDGLDYNQTTGRDEEIDQVLRHIRPALDEEQGITLAEPVAPGEILVALKSTKNDSAAGADGIQYEVWKTLHERYIEDTKHEGRSPLNVVAMLNALYADIEVYGVVPGSAFSEGIVCPMYKQKGERTKIASYRPITLLNTDYKLLSKVLAARLAKDLYRAAAFMTIRN